MFLMEIWKRGNTILHPGSDFVDGFATRSAEAGVARPPRETRRRVRWSPTMDVARPPHVVCRGGNCETACVWSGSSGFTLSDGV